MYIDANTPLQITRGNAPAGEEIYYPGDIHIDCDVHGGVTICAAGSITITGNVELASLRAGRDIMVKGSATGSPKTTFVAGGDIRLASAYNINARAGNNLEVFSDVEISQLYAGGQITLLTGTVRDSRLLALKGLWLSQAKSTEPRACSLAVGYHYEYFNRWNAFLQSQKNIQTAQQQQLNDMAPLLRRLAQDTGLKKKMTHDVEARMSVIRENAYNLEKIAQNIDHFSQLAMTDAIPILVCEKVIETGCVVALQQFSLPLTESISGPITLAINAEKQNISKTPGLHGLQKKRKEIG